MIDFDAEASRRLEAVYKTPDVVAQRGRVLAALALSAGERVLDVGSGPGLLAAEMAAAVGPTGRVCGIDSSDSMLAIANGRDVRPGSGGLEFVPGPAALIPYATASFDVAVSTQVYEYVEDLPRAIAELHRVVRPGGRVAILDTDWDSVVCHSRDRQRTARVLSVWEEHCVDPRLPRRLRAVLVHAGFVTLTCEVVPMLNLGYDRKTYSAGMIELIAAFVSGRGGISAETASDWLAEVVALGEDYFFSVNRYLFTAGRGED